MSRLATFLINTIAALDCVHDWQRLAIYRRYGMVTPDDVFIRSRCFFSQPDLSNIAIGGNTFLNQHIYIDSAATVTIGSNVAIAPHCKILTTTHYIGSSDRRVGDGCVKLPVVIGDGSWIGAGCTILPGVTIGKGCVIAAGSVVREDCEDNWLYGGVPARPIKRLPE